MGGTSRTEEREYRRESMKIINTSTGKEILIEANGPVSAKDLSTQR